jgi:hypothetical protein
VNELTSQVDISSIATSQFIANRTTARHGKAGIAT